MCFLDIPYHLETDFCDIRLEEFINWNCWIEVTLYDDGQTKTNTAAWPQCGRAIANLLALKVLPENEKKDKSSALSRFKNETTYISAFLTSQKDMSDSVLASYWPYGG